MISKTNFIGLLTFYFIIFILDHDILAQTTKDDLVGKRWGLTGIYEHISNRKDTLILVRDCANEYYELLPKGTLVSSYLERDGKWELNQDSLLVFKKNNGRIFKKSVIKYITPDSLILRDEGKNHYFTEIYEFCSPNDSTYVDNRKTYQEFKTRNILLGASYLNTVTAEIGFAISRMNWNKTMYSNSINLELAPQKKVYGISVNTWWEGKFLAYGLSGTAHMDHGKMLFGFRPMIGLTAQRLINRNNRSGISCHIMYGYTIFLPHDESFERSVNRDAVHLRVMIPFQKSAPQIVRKSVFHD